MESTEAVSARALLDIASRALKGAVDFANGAPPAVTDPLTDALAETKRAQRALNKALKDA